MPPILLMALLFTPQEKPPERCTVSGTVVDSVTQKPVAKVAIELRPVERAANHIAATRTDAAGHFTLVDVDPGSYRLAGSRPGYLETVHRTVLQLDGGQSVDDLKLKLVPGAVIAGRILDPDGDPVGDAHLVLARRTAEYGRPRIEGYDSTNADEEGGFRFAGLQPGRYYVLAEPPVAEWNTIDHSPRSDKPREALVPTLYPGAPDLAGAAPVDIRPGERREGFDLLLLRRRVFRVSGRVLNVAESRSSLTLLDLALEGLGNRALQTATRNGTGEFEFRDVAPGSYWIVAGQSRARIDVGYGDLDGLRLTAGRGAELKVTVAGEGGPKVEDFEILVTKDGRRGCMWNVHFPPGAASACEPGLSDVRVSRAPKGFYVKSVRWGDRDALADPVNVPESGVLALEIAVAADGAKLEGGSDPGATVVLVPPARGRVDLYRSVTTDQYGRYSFADVAPGTYKLFAWDDVAEDEWLDPDFLKRFEDQGLEVKLDPRGAKSVDVKIRP